MEGASALRRRRAGCGAPLPMDKNWYIIHTYSGFEQKVADSLRSRAQAFGFATDWPMLIPTEEVVELRAGKKVTSKRLLYPGYVMVQMEMNDQLWHEVKNTPRVTGFVGGGNSPVPLTADEVNSILFRQQTSGGAPASEDERSRRARWCASTTDRSPISQAKWTKSIRSETHCACW